MSSGIRILERLPLLKLQDPVFTVRMPTNDLAKTGSPFPLADMPKLLLHEPLLSKRHYFRNPRRITAKEPQFTGMS